MTDLSKQHIVYMTDKFPDHETAHGRAAQGLMSLLLTNGCKLTVIAEGPDRKDVWYKGQYRYIGLGIGDRRYKSSEILAAKLKALKACKNLPEKSVVICDASAYLTLPHVFSWAKRHSCQTLYWAHAVYPEAFSAHDIQVSRYFGLKVKQDCRYTMKHSDLVIVENLSTYKYLSHTGINTRKIKIISSWDMALKYTRAGRMKQNTVNDNQLKTNPSMNSLGGSFDISASCLKRLAQEQKFRVLHSGELHRSKSLHALLAVAQRLDQDNPEIEFVFSGYGAGMEYLYKERTKRGLENVRLMPLQPKQDYLSFLESGDLHISLESSNFKKVVGGFHVEQAIYTKRPYLVLDDDVSEGGHDRNGIGEYIDINDPKNIYKAITKYRYDADAWFAAHDAAKTFAHDSDFSDSKKWLSLLDRASNALGS